MSNKFIFRLFLKILKIMEFSKNTLLVGAEDFSVELLELSRPGKRKISVADFYNGSRNFFNLGKYLT